MSFTFYHNPRCRKSREALSILEEHTDDIEIVEYLKEPPSEVELKRIIGLLGIDAIELVRKGEDDFKINFKGQDLPEGEWIKAMVKYPKLIERPIILKGNRAIIGRPPENVKLLF
jgi:arsenate reductase (glutaredoxin)